MGRAKHPKKDVERAVAFAIEHGWSLELRSGRGHAWGLLRCPTGEDYVYVWSTPRVPSNHAKQIQRAVIHCPHQTEPRP
jgi:hypothetical protein